MKDPRKWHIGGLNGLLDRNFRLPREDTAGQLRDAISYLTSTGRNTHQQLRTHVYSHVQVRYIGFDRTAGLQFDLVLSQPIETKKMGKQQRQEWWLRTKRLQPGALLYLVGTQDAIFCTVSLTPIQDKKGNVPKYKTSLWDNEYTATEVGARAVLRGQSRVRTQSVQNEDIFRSSSSLALSCHRLCQQAVVKQVPGCNHIVTVPCHVNVTTPEYKCNIPCQTTLSCGHTCRRNCRDCTVHDKDEIKVNHGECLQVCGRNQPTCIHACQTPCHGTKPCPPCKMPCEIKCVHLKC